MMIKKIVFKGVIFGSLFVFMLTPSAAETQAERDFYNQIPKFTRMNLDFLSGSMTFNSCNIWPWFCIPNMPCDNVIKCVMKKQRETLKARLDDLIKAIKANTKQTKHQTKIIEQEVLAYRRLLERVKKESLSLKEASYISKKIKDSEALGTSINIIGEGK